MYTPTLCAVPLLVRHGQLLCYFDRVDEARASFLQSSKNGNYQASLTYGMIGMGSGITPLSPLPLTATYYRRSTHICLHLLANHHTHTGHSSLWLLIYIQTSLYYSRQSFSKSRSSHTNLWADIRPGRINFVQKCSEVDQEMFSVLSAALQVISIEPPMPFVSLTHRCRMIRSLYTSIGLQSD